MWWFVFVINTEIQRYENGIGKNMRLIVILAVSLFNCCYSMSELVQMIRFAISKLP